MSEFAREQWNDMQREAFVGEEEREPGAEALFWAAVYDLEQGNTRIADGVRRLLADGWDVGEPLLDGGYCPEGEQFSMGGELTTWRRRPDGVNVRRVVVLASRDVDGVHQQIEVGIEQGWDGAQRFEKVSKRWLMGQPVKAAPAEVVTETLRPAKKECSRCGGGGYIPQFRHIEGGRCFKCNPRSGEA